MPKQKKQELIHVRLNYDEAFQAKKDVLNSQANLIRIAQGIQSYLPLRQEELKVKAKIKSLLKEVNKDINKLEDVLPKPEVPKMLKEKMSIFDEEELEEARHKEFTQSLHDELADIQRKINELQS